MDLRERIFGESERISLQRDARITKLKAKATASLDMAKVQRDRMNPIGVEHALAEMDRAIDDLCALGFGR